MKTKVILDAKAMDRALVRISYEIIERNRGASDLCIIGILNRGSELAQTIAQKIGALEKCTVPTGALDVTCHRDDRKAGDDYHSKTNIPFSITGKTVVLVDDVIYTGRTIRSALDALVDLGRPERIELAVLVDRGHRECPIRADFVGKNLPTSQQEQVAVCVRGMDGVDQVLLVSQEDV